MMLAEFSEKKMGKRIADHFTEKRFENMKHRPKTQERQTEARAYCSEHDRCGWTDTKPGEQDTSTSFDTPDIQRDWSNTV